MTFWTFAFFLKAKSEKPEIWKIMMSIIMKILLCRYIIMYRCDDSFDNKYIDDNIKKKWKKGDESKLTPLRKWEEEEKYQVTTSYKLTRSEMKGILVKLIPTLIFSTVSIALMVADAALYSFMNIIKENGKYGLSFPGNVIYF